MRRLTRRAQFVAAARGARTHKRAFVLQRAPNGAEDARIGFTVTRRTGNAVERHRIRRRLKAAAMHNVSQFAPGHDYVLIGRRDALHEPFERLVGELKAALEQIERRDAREAGRDGR
jgi:ribonuclease P protein component